MDFIRNLKEKYPTKECGHWSLLVPHISEIVRMTTNLKK